MRSRDGNQTRLFSVLSIIFFYSLSLSASEYLISYRYVVKDMILYNDSFAVSRAMKQCKGKPQNSIELPDEDSNDLNEVITNNAEAFMDFIQKIGLDVEHKETTINAQNSSTTILTLKTTCFKVDFNDNFARITHIK